MWGGWGGLVNKDVFNIMCSENGSGLCRKDMEVVDLEIEDKVMGFVMGGDSEWGLRFRGNISGGGSSVRSGGDSYREKGCGKRVILRVVEEGKIYNLRLELSLNIWNGNDEDRWGLFDRGNMGDSCEFMYDMRLIGEGIIVEWVEGKISVNCVESSSKDRGVGDNVYVWGYNCVRGLWLWIGKFRIEEGNNRDDWDVCWGR